MRHYYSSKISLLLMTCAAILPLHADPIDKFEAKRIAAQFLTQPKLQHDKVETRAGATDTPPAYYLFNDADNRGFVIVSGEDRLNPLVGYSDNAVVNGQQLPEPLKDFLEAYTAVVENVRTGKATTSQPAVVAKAKVEPLLKTNWGQSAPYNDFTPRHSGKPTFTGCVATAMAQVMNYYKWPLNRPQTHPKAQDQLAQSKAVYLWDEMKNVYFPGDRSMAASAVATLMRDIGANVRMEYGIVESGARLLDAVYAFETVFDYSTTHLFKDYMPAGDYQRCIMQQLANGNPVFAGGGRHAFVYDGYDEKGFIHTNWGWDGLYNGYFDINTISLSKVGTGGGDGRYWYNQEVIIAHPNNGQYDTTEIRPRRLSLFSNGELFFQQDEADRNTPIVATLTNLCSSNRIKGALGAFTGMVGLGVYNATGDLVTVIPHPGGNHRFISHYGYLNLKNWSVDFSALAEGEYTVIPMSRELLAQPSTYAQWLQIESANTVHLTVTRDKVTIKQNKGRRHLSMAKSPELVAPLYLESRNNGAATLSVNNATSLETRGSLIMHFKGIGHNFEYTTPAAQETVVVERMGITQLTVAIPTSYNKAGVTTYLAKGRYEVSFEIQYKDDQNNPHLIAIENDTPFEIEVLPKTFKSVVSIKRVDFLDNGSPTDLQVFDQQKTASIGLKVHSDVQGYTGASDYKGKLYYRLKDLEDGSVVDVGSCASVILPRGKENNADQTLVEFSPSLLKAGHIYEVHIEIEANGTRVDVWNNSTPRRVLSVANEHLITTILPHTDKRSAPTVIYNLQGTRLHTPLQQLPQGIYIVNGKKVIKP